MDLNTLSNEAELFYLALKFYYSSFSSFIDNYSVSIFYFLFLFANFKKITNNFIITCYSSFLPTKTSLGFEPLGGPTIPRSSKRSIHLAALL